MLRLERVVLQQARSRYEVQGEYTIPSTADIPRSAASLALAAPPTGIAGSAAAATGNGGNATSPAMGRWRLQVRLSASDTQDVHNLAEALRSDNRSSGCKSQSC